MAYLIKQDPSLSLADALLKVRVARATAQPNPGFMSQLETFRNSLNAKEQEEDKEGKDKEDEEEKKEDEEEEKEDKEEKVL